MFLSDSLPLLHHRSGHRSGIFLMASSIRQVSRQLNRPTASFPSARAALSRPFCTTKKQLIQPPAGKDTAPTPTPRPTRPPPPRRRSSPIRIWPLFAIFAGGTYLFDLMVKQRSGTAPKGEKTLSSRPFCMLFTFLTTDSTEGTGQHSLT
jgi:hypothetical protein